MKVKILRNTIAEGHPVFAGGVEDVSEKAAHDLVFAGKAEFCTAPVKPSIAELRNIEHGRIVAVLGGGPSLPADLEKIKTSNAVLIAVNHHAQRIADCQYMVFFDDPVKSAEIGKTAKEFEGVIITPFGDFATHYLDVEYVNCGMTSGLAVWLAEYLGAKEILLCGMDCFASKDRYFYPVEEILRNEDSAKQIAWWKALSKEISTPVKAVSGPLTKVFKKYNAPRNKKDS